MSTEVEDLFIKEENVVNGEPDEWDVAAVLGRKAVAGTVTNDGSADITVTINRRFMFTLKSDEVWSWGPETRKLRVFRVKFSTASASPQSYRLQCW